MINKTSPKLNTRVAYSLCQGSFSHAIGHFEVDIKQWYKISSFMRVTFTWSLDYYLPLVLVRRQNDGYLSWLIPVNNTVWSGFVCKINSCYIRHWSRYFTTILLTVKSNTSDSNSHDVFTRGWTSINSPIHSRKLAHFLCLTRYSIK